MSAFLYRLGHAMVRRARTVLLAWLAVLLVAGGAAALVGMQMDDQVTIPGTEAQNGIDLLGHRFPELAGTSAQVLFIAPEGSQVADFKAEIGEILAPLDGVEAVAVVADPFDPSTPITRADDGRHALSQIQLSVGLGEVPPETMTALEGLAGTTASGLDVHVGGAVFTTTSIELSIAEVIGVGIAVLVLAITFGSMLAAGLPLLTAIVGVGVTMVGILVAAALIPVNASTSTLAIMIGLAVGIDYALFIVSRHRDLLTQGLPVPEAAARAVATAGGAVVFAGLTVIVALCGLAVVGIPFLTTMGVAAAAGVALAVVVALTLLPALLGVAGERLTPRPKRARVKKRAAAASSAASEKPQTADAPAHVPPARHGFASRWVRFVTARPVATIVVVVVGLIVLAIPFKDLRLGLPDNGTATVGTVQRDTYDLIADAYGAGYNSPLIVTADIITTTDPLGVMDSLASDLGALDGVSGVGIATPNRGADLGIVQLVPAGGQTDEVTADLVHAIRELAPELEQRYGVSDITVTGAAAVAIDVSERLAGALVPFGLVVVGLSLLILTLVFRSIWVPLKATLGYVLSVFASFGVIAAVFEWGWGADLINLDQTGPVISFLPVILMGVLFGLAMDYEVFLVSRMREDWVHSGDARRSVLTGFVGSARVVTAAAVIMIAVFAGFVPESLAMIKPIAVGLAVGVAIDAFLVRMTLVPAVMMLLGERAWWLPASWARAIPVVDIEGEGLARRLAAEESRAARPRAAIHARGLTIGGNRGDVVRGLDLDIPPGTLLVVHGPAGTGKTALLLALAGRLDSSADSLEVAEHLLPDERSAVQRSVALAEVRGVNDLEPALSVAQHVAERVSATSVKPWVRRAEVTRVTDLVTGLDPSLGLDPAALVADLPPLERKVLGVLLAAASGAAVVVVDDADTLRDPADQAAFWRVLTWLTTVTPDGHDAPLTVLASAAAPPEVVDDGAGGLAAVLVLDLSPSTLLEEVR